VDEIDAVTIEATDASRLDIYLQPHSDDVCFSLGALAHRRRRGLLLTVFSIAHMLLHVRALHLPPLSRDRHPARGG